MEVSEFIKLFCESFDELDVSIHPDTKFKDLEQWTSMQALLFIAHVDDAVGFVYTAEHIREAKTVEDLYQIYLKG